MLLCKDCKWFMGLMAAHECEAPKNKVSKPDYVNGGERVYHIWQTAENARSQQHISCGPAGLWHEPKEPVSDAADPYYATRISAGAPSGFGGGGGGGAQAVTYATGSNGKGGRELDTPAEGAKS